MTDLIGLTENGTLNTKPCHQQQKLCVCYVHHVEFFISIEYIELLVSSGLSR